MSRDLKERAKEIQGRCVHFNGVQNKSCRAGVLYDGARQKHAPISYKSRDGRTYQSSVSLPCNASLNHAGVRCPCAHYPTEQEAREQAEQKEKEIGEFLTHMGAARKVITEQTQNKGGRGTVPCPKCGGTLSFSQAASNKHVHARCQTPDCLAWME